VALAVLAGVVLVAALLAATIGPLARSDGVTGGEPDVPAAAIGDVEPTAAARTQPTDASPSESPVSAVVLPSTLLTVDLHPVGSLDVRELPITRVSGAPEVVPFPTPFDRSVRLRGAAAGFCVEAPSPSEGRGTSTAFDLHLGQAGADGWLMVSLPATADGPPTGLRVDIAMLAELDRENWYRLTVTTDGRTSRIEVAPVGGGGPVLEDEVSIDATVQASSTEVCVGSSRQAAGAALFIDNLRIDG
jgi:hypothetical protein